MTFLVVLLYVTESWKIILFYFFEQKVFVYLNSSFFCIFAFKNLNRIYFCDLRVSRVCRKFSKSDGKIFLSTQLTIIATGFIIRMFWYTLAWRYQHVIGSLFGYNHIPLWGFTCSYECAVNAQESFSMKNEAYLKKIAAANVYVYDIRIEDWVGDHSYKFRKRHNGRFMRTMRRMKRLFTR